MGEDVREFHMCAQVFCSKQSCYAGKNILYEQTTIMKIVLSLTVVLPLFALLNANSYCDQSKCTKLGRTHTMCKYPSSKPGRACGSNIKAGLTTKEQVAIVNKHNDLREFVARGYEKRGLPGPQPRAINMYPLKWDNELATVAQRWANQCTFRHDSCRDVSRFQVGQNIGTRSTTGVNNSTATMVITAWYDEVALFDRNQVHRLRDIENVGHYTQIVWAQTLLVGCGQITYKEPDGWNTYQLVCNYGPAGNFRGAAVYKTPE